MRKWLARRFQTFPFCAEQRQQYLDDCSDLIATYPFFRRLWCRYLYWIATSARIKIIFSARAVIHRCATTLYRTIDRFAGGERYRRYLQRRLAAFEAREKEPKAGEKVRQLRELNYHLRVLQESLKNPHFAQPPEKIQ